MDAKDGILRVHRRRTGGTHCCTFVVDRFRSSFDDFALLSPLQLSIGLRQAFLVSILRTSFVFSSPICVRGFSTAGSQVDFSRGEWPTRPLRRFAPAVVVQTLYPIRARLRHPMSDQPRSSTGDVGAMRGLIYRNLIALIRLPNFLNTAAGLISGALEATAWLTRLETDDAYVERRVGRGVPSSGRDSTRRSQLSGEPRAVR